MEAAVPRPLQGIPGQGLHDTLPHCGGEGRTYALYCLLESICVCLHARGIMKAAVPRPLPGIPGQGLHDMLPHCGREGRQYTIVVSL